jgi:hypothetical protein
VTGLIGQHPALGGVTWFHLHYLLGLARLGHDVYYLEDSGEWPYRLNPDPSTGDWVARDPAPTVTYLENVMSRFGFDDKWSYRFPLESRWFGLSDRQRTELTESADLLINVSGTLEHPEHYRRVPRLVYVDTDPVFTQVKLARGEAAFCDRVNAHDLHFSYGECLSAGAVPETGHRWSPTRAPVVLSEWNPATPQRSVFTTVMNWTSYDSEVYGGQIYGQKNVEFMRFVDLPSLVAPTILELAIGMGKNETAPCDSLRHKGWHLVDPASVCSNLDSFRKYTESSHAEWTIAKHGYVAGKSGWFSERSARYLAAGRPVVAQDTGFTQIIPAGDGLLAFQTVEDAVAAIHEVELNYKRHAKAARDLAEEYFGSDKVLGRLVEDIYDTRSQSSHGRALR